MKATQAIAEQSPAAEHSGKRKGASSANKSPKEQGHLSAEQAALLNAAFKGQGAPIEPSVRRNLEKRLNCSLDSIRIHADAASHAVARSLDAEAFTFRQHVFFTAGRYEPGEARGRRLLLHEVLHAVSLGGAAAHAPLEQGDA